MLRTVAAAVVDTVQAPPAVVFLQALQYQIPTAVRFTESCSESRKSHFLYALVVQLVQGVQEAGGKLTFPQKVQV